MKTKIISGALLSGALSLSLIAAANNNPGQKSNAVIETKINDIKPQDIIDKYIQAIGGKDNIDKVKTVHSTGTASVQGQSLSYETKRMNPNKTLVDVTMDGQTVSRQVFDGVTGYKEQMGNKTDYTPDEIKQYTDVKSLFPQEFYANSGYTLALKGTTIVNGKPAYTIDVTSPSGDKTTEYYDSVSYLLVRLDATEGAVSINTTFSDYRTVNNVLVPYKMVQDINTDNGEMEVDIVAETYTINGNDVTDADFK